MNSEQMFQQAAWAAQNAMNGFGTQQPYDAEQFYAQAAAEAANNANAQYGQQQSYQNPYQQTQFQNQQNFAQDPCQCQPQEEGKEAKGFLRNFIDYLKNGGFKNDIDCTSKQYNVPPKQLAQNFLERCLGTISDILGVVISTAGNAVHTLIDVLSTLAHGAANVAVNVVNGLVKFFTLNKTCVA